ncbi:MAG: hypothetical protein P9L96_01375 [Candidatus Gygaella obscura]|nr:hypothetical protein [Candidatus Gygaella obscura]
MKKLIILALAIVVSLNLASSVFAATKWISGYSTRSGQYRSGHFRDTSNDGYLYNNANYLGLND